jgi:hypothetical protein
MAGHRRRDQERSDEEEEERIAERREGLLGRRDTEQDGERRSEKPRGGKGDRLRDPEDDGQREDGGEAARRPLEPERNDENERRRRGR